MKQENNRNEDFLRALRGVPRATPPPEVWANIERMTAGPRIRSLNPSDWRRTAVAAAIVLILNTAAVTWSLTNASGNAASGNEITLVSDYELYN